MGNLELECAVITGTLRFTCSTNRYCSVNQALFEVVTLSFQKSSRWLDLTSNPMHLRDKSMAAVNPRYSLLTRETWDGCVLLRRARTVGTQT